MDHIEIAMENYGPWSKIAGQKAPLKLKEILAIRIRLQIANTYV